MPWRTQTPMSSLSSNHPLVPTTQGGWLGVPSVFMGALHMTMINRSVLEIRKIPIKQPFLLLPSSASFPPLPLPSCWIYIFQDLKSCFAFPGIMWPTTFLRSTKTSSYQMSYLRVCLPHKIQATLRIKQFRWNFACLQCPPTEPCFMSPPNPCQSESLCSASNSPGLLWCPPQSSV